MADYTEVQKAIEDAKPKLGESRWRSADHALRELQAIAEKNIDSARLWRNRALSLQRELIAVVGSCPATDCVRHLGHLGPCPVKAEEFEDA